MAPFRLSLAVLCLAGSLLSLSAITAGQGVAKTNPTQESVASRSAKFATISKNDPAVRKALACKDLAGATRLAGKPGAFTGVVSSVYSPKDHGSVFIDFSEPWKNSISGHVKAADYAKFPALSALKGKQVLITGAFTLYSHSHPEIQVTSLSQIKLVK
ncbi:MAG TPA: hypothetical protein VHE55_05210 [Fimbriimonadaceae bacterium]|nr:hypothetical protein [Fimbriimonadaceae bacterium]